jgi:hypothetical protein
MKNLVLITARPDRFQTYKYTHTHAHTHTNTCTYITSLVVCADGQALHPKPQDLYCAVECLLQISSPSIKDMKTLQPLVQSLRRSSKGHPNASKGFKSESLAEALARVSACMCDLPVDAESASNLDVDLSGCSNKSVEADKHKNNEDDDFTRGQNLMHMQSEQIKERANEHFKNGRFGLAKSTYLSALAILKTKGEMH